MRLEYNVLWVEDQPDRVNAQRNRIERDIRKEGFRLDTKFAASVDEAVVLLTDNIYGDHIDLVLMDQDLGPGKKGEDGLVEVRRKFAHKDLIFYSANAQNLGSLVESKHLQGVYWSTRDELPDEVLGVFQSLVRKVLDIDQARGIVMGCSSDIDGLVFDSIDATFRKDSGKLSDAAKKRISDHLKNITTTFEKNAQRLGAVTTVAELGDLHFVYSSDYRHRLLLGLLDKQSQYENVRTAIKEYLEHVTPVRNTLAHVRVSRSGFARTLTDKNGNEITRDTVRELMLRLLSHQEALEELLDSLSQG